MFVLIVALVLVVFGAVDVHSDCHNSDPCEDVHNDVISGHRWDTNHNNDVRLLRPVFTKLNEMRVR